MRLVTGNGRSCVLGLAAGCSCLGRPHPASWRRIRSTRAPGATAERRVRERAHGTVTGATWATGRYGGALSFDGTNAYVDLGALGTFYQTRPSRSRPGCRSNATKNDVGIVGSWAGSGPMLWIDHLATHYQLTLGGSLSIYLDSGQNPIVGQWQHLAATFDGTTARYYIDGTEVASPRRLRLRRHLEHLADRRLRQRRPAASSTA